MRIPVEKSNPPSLPVAHLLTAWYTFEMRARNREYLQKLSQSLGQTKKKLATKGRTETKSLAEVLYFLQHGGNLLKRLKGKITFSSAAAAHECHRIAIKLGLILSK